MTPIATRFSVEEIALIDEMVGARVGDNRSAVVREAVIRLADCVRRAHAGELIARSYRDLPQSEDDNAVARANAVALVEAEPW